MIIAFPRKDLAYSAKIRFSESDTPSDLSNVMPCASIRTICHISLVPSMLSPMQRNVPRCVSIMPMLISSQSSEGSTTCASRRNVAVCMMSIHLMDTISVHSVGRIGEPKLSREPDRFLTMWMKKRARIASLSFRQTEFLHADMRAILASSLIIMSSTFRSGK